MSENGTQKRITVCVLTPHPLVLTEFQRILAEAPFQVKAIRLEPGQTDLLDGVPMADTFLVDVHAAVPRGPALIASLMARYPDCRVIAVAERFSEESAFPLLSGGAKGLMTYEQAPRFAQSAIESIAAGGFWVPRMLLSRFVDAILSRTPVRRLNNNTQELSPREQQVLEGLMTNLSNKEIGNQLHISERTVKFHVSNLLTKFGVRRRADLIVLGYQQAPRVAV